MYGLRGRAHYAWRRDRLRPAGSSWVEGWIGGGLSAHRFRGSVRPGGPCSVGQAGSLLVVAWRPVFSLEGSACLVVGLGLMVGEDDWLFSARLCRGR